MDANKFATMLHKKTNKIKHTLVLAVLEWTLIILLLLNGLFQYLIIKFANYFGLMPPCLWCSRIDHFMEPRKCSNIHGDHLCKSHSEEVSKLGYCSTHQKLAAYQSMCEDCSSSRPDFCGVSKKLNIFPWVKPTGVIHNDEDMVIDDGKEALVHCSCCGVSLEKNIYSPNVLINPSNWDHFKYGIQKENLIIEEGENDDYGTKYDNLDHTGIDFTIELISDANGFKSKSEKQLISCIDGVFEGNSDLNEEENSGITMKGLSFDKTVHQCCREGDASFGIQQQHLEFLFDSSGQQLVPVELISSLTEENKIQHRVEETEKNSDHQQARLGSEFDTAAQVVSDVDHIEETKSGLPEFIEVEETENSLVLHAKDCDLVYEQLIHIIVQDTAPYFVAVSEEASKMQIDKTEPEASLGTETALVFMEESKQNVPTATEDASPFIMSDTDTEVSIGTEIPDLNSTEETNTKDNNCLHEEASTSCTNFYAHYEYGSETDSQETVDLSTFMIELNDHMINSQSSVYLEFNGNEEEKMCDRPSSSDGHYHVHKTWLFHERKDSGDEESLERGIISELGDEVMTVERLNSTLRAERKALNDVYAELEEERNASAIAANQTMAMINRLQEEKAAMQMEALHYQRMMEEKLEYDQEAMQIMNDLMVEKERERQGLEKELEICRKKLLDYEAKENMNLLRRSKVESATGVFSPFSCSNEEDSDEVSIDLNQESKEENGFYSHREIGNLNTPVDSDLYIRYPFGDFEEERMSIMHQLKVLEDKLCTVGEHEHHFEGGRPFYEKNGKHLERSSESTGEEVDQLLNGYSKENEKFNVHDNGFDAAVMRFELEDGRAAIEKEVN